MIAIDGRCGVTHHLVTEFVGDFDDGVLRSAWQSLACRHPVLSATLTGSGRHWAPDQQELGFASLRAGNDLEIDQLIQTLCASRLRNDPVEAGRLTVLRGHAASNGYLVMSFHHAVVDGRGALLLFDELRCRYVRALAGSAAESMTVDTSPRTIARATLAAGVDATARASIIRTAASRWAEAAPSSHVEPAGQPGDGELPGVRAFRLSPSPLGPLRRLRATSGWTATDVIVGAVARAWEEAIGRDHTRDRTSGWLVTADGRRPLGLANGIGNLSGIEPIALARIGGGWAEDSIAAAAAALAPIRAGHPGVGADLAAVELEALGVPIPPWLNRALLRFGTERSRYTRAIANFGVVPPSLGRWQSADLIDLWWAPPLADPPFLNLTFTAFGDCLTISARTHPHGLNRDLAGDLVDAFVETLDDLPHSP